MKLTEDDIDVIGTDQGSNNPFWVDCIRVLPNQHPTLEVAQQVRKQILENQEKAEKYDEIDEHNKILRMRIGDRVIEIQNLSHTIETLAKDNQRLEQENKHLKEDNQKSTERILELMDNEDDLKQKLETSYEALQRIRDERNTAWTKLEKIEELYKNSPPYDQNLGIKLKKILGETK